MRMKQQAAQMEHQAVVAAVGKLIKVFYLCMDYPHICILVIVCCIVNVLLELMNCILESCPRIFGSNVCFAG